jgi:hypothetical protein
LPWEFEDVKHLPVVLDGPPVIDDCPLAFASHMWFPMLNERRMDVELEKWLD